MEITEGKAEASMVVTPDLCHAAGSMHGAYYFKLLDDAAFFAANSVVQDVFVLTADFSIQLFRPVVSGRATAYGTVTKAGRTLIFAESVLVDDKGRELARGRGTFARSQTVLADIAPYRDA